MGLVQVGNVALFNGNVASCRGIHLCTLTRRGILRIVGIFVHIDDGHRNQICIPESVEGQILVDRCGKIKCRVVVLIRGPAAEGIARTGGLAAGCGVAFGNNLGRHRCTAVCNEADGHRVRIPCVQVQCFTICTLVNCIADRGIKIESLQVSNRAIALHRGRPALEDLAHQCGTLGRCYSFPRHCGKGQVYGLTILAVEVDIIYAFRIGLYPLCMECGISVDHSFGGEFRGQCFIRIPSGEDHYKLSVRSLPNRLRQIRNGLSSRNCDGIWSSYACCGSIISHTKGHGIFRRRYGCLDGFGMCSPSSSSPPRRRSSIIGMCNGCGSRRNTGDGGRGSFVVITQSKINFCYSLVVTCPGFLMVRIR